MFVVHMVLGAIGGLATAGGSIYAGASIWEAVAGYIASGNITFIGSLALAMLITGGEAGEAEREAVELEFA